MISHIMTLANGIIGVSVLAMPFCFKQCGIILATLVLLLSSLLSRLACHFLIKSAVMSRRRNFEFLAFHAFGPMAKFLVELCIIGFLLGTCIAFFVVLGDLGPQILGEMINKRSEDIRTSFLITTGIFIVLPLGLLRNIDSLASVSTASIAFYICLVFKIIAESTHHIFDADWIDNVHFWKPAGILQCLPIFALALFCQTQLFEIYEAMPNATLEKMNEVVRGALNICTGVYLCVGFFGYIAFCTQPFSGNILLSLEPSMTSEIIKIGFVLSVAFSFPLVIFPCRASLNSLLFRRGYTHMETSTSYISEARFRCLTTFIVTIALTIGVLIPNIEFVLGIVGSTIGVIICLIFPAAFFISISTKNTNERLLAQILVVTGIWIMILGTYANLYAMEQSSNLRPTVADVKISDQNILPNIPDILVNNELLMKPDEPKQPDILLKAAEIPEPKAPDKPLDNENVRQEPPVPVERLAENEKLANKQDQLVLEAVTISPKIQEIVDKISHMDNELIKEANKAYDSLKKTKVINDDLIIKQEVNPEPAKEDEKASVLKNDVIAVDAIKKEELELAADKELSNVDPLQRREQLQKTLEKHIMQQKDLMQEQKELLKNIEQSKKELQKANQEKIKNNILEPNNGVEIKQEEVELPNVAAKNELKNENVMDQINVNLQQPEDSVIPNKISETIAKDSPNNKDNIDSNEIPVEPDKKLIQNNQPGDNQDLRSIKEQSINSNLSQPPVDIQIKKIRGPIINALTKQTDKLSDQNKAADIPKNKNSNLDVKLIHNENDNVKLDTKPLNNANNRISKNEELNNNKESNMKLDVESTNDKKNNKINEYSIPIALKMNNQTRRVSDQEKTVINQSNVDVAAVGRDILQEHQRDKRMANEENDNVLRTSYKDDNINYNNDINVDNVAVNKKEICTKKENNVQTVNEKKIVEPNELNDGENSGNLIKTSAFLSEQDIVKKVSIDPDLTAGSNFVKLKKRDLKTLNFDNENEK